MTLCAQCHGPQFRDYQHGAHGGMTGYWDLTKGGRMRNNCIDCHDPHAPKYPTVTPGPRPERPLPDAEAAMSESKKFSLPVLGEVDRRTAMKAGAATLGLAAWAAAIEPWFEWTGELSTDEFLQKHYRELTPEQLQVILNRLTDEARKETGKPVIGEGPQADPRRVSSATR